MQRAIIDLTCAGNDDRHMGVVLHALQVVRGERFCWWPYDTYLSRASVDGLGFVTVVTLGDLSRKASRV